MSWSSAWQRPPLASAQQDTAKQPPRTAPSPHAEPALETRRAYGPIHPPGNSVHRLLYKGTPYPLTRLL
eukprot:2586660-Rhodomonas_salina.5